MFKSVIIIILCIISYIIYKTLLKKEVNEHFVNDIEGGDTPGWENGFSYDCGAYSKRWCKGGAARPGSKWTLGGKHNFPEKNCVVCGKGGSKMTIKLVGDDYLHIYHETGAGVRSKLTDGKYTSSEKIQANAGKWLRLPELGDGWVSCCNKVINVTIDNFKPSDTILFFSGNSGGPGYIAGEIEYNGQTYYTNSSPDGNWKCLGILPGGSRNAVLIDKSLLPPAEGEPYVGKVAKTAKGTPCVNNERWVEAVSLYRSYYNLIGAGDQGINVLKLPQIKGSTCVKLGTVLSNRGEEITCFVNESEGLELLAGVGFMREKPVTIQSIVDYYGKMPPRGSGRFVIDVITQQGGLPDGSPPPVANENKKVMDSADGKLKWRHEIDVRNAINSRSGSARPQECKIPTVDDVVPFPFSKDLRKDAKGASWKPFWFKSGKLLGCSSNADIELPINGHMDNGEPVKVSNEQCRDAAMSQGLSYYGLQEGGFCNLPNRPSNMTDSIKQTLQANQVNGCNTNSGVVWGQKTGSSGYNNIFSTKEAPVLSDATTIRMFSGINEDTRQKFKNEGEMSNLLITSAAADSDNFGGMYMGWVVIEFKLKNSIKKFCPDPDDEKWTPHGCSDRTDKSSCTNTPVVYNSVTRFEPDMSMCSGTPYSEFPVTNSFPNSDSTSGRPSTNVNFSKLIMGSLEKLISTPLSHGGVKKGFIYKSDKENYIKSLNSVLSISKEIITSNGNDTEVIIYSADKLTTGEAAVYLAGIGPKIIDAIKKTYEITISDGAKTKGMGGGSYGRSSVNNTEETGPVTKFKTRLENLIKISRIINSLGECTQEGKERGSCNSYGIVPPNSANVPAYHRKPILIAKKIIQSGVNGTRCAFRRGKSIGNNEYQAVWNCGGPSNKPLVSRGWNPANTKVTIWRNKKHGHSKLGKFGSSSSVDPNSSSRNWTRSSIFWAYSANERAPGTDILYVSQYGSTFGSLQGSTNRFKVSWKNTCCGWKDYFTIRVYKNKPANIPGLVKYIVRDKGAPHVFLVGPEGPQERRLAKQLGYGGQRTSFWAFASKPRLGKCEGDCDNDTECGGGLKCKQRNGNGKVMGCYRGGKGDISGMDYCYDPTPRYSGDVSAAKVYYNEGIIKTRIRNKECGLEWDSRVSNNRRNAKWDCGKAGGDPLEYDEVTGAITSKVSRNGKVEVCTLTHNKSDRGIVKAEWDCVARDGVTITQT